MNATSTHDTKRSEDVRARIHVLSEVPEVWARKATEWARTNEDQRAYDSDLLVPDRNDEYLLYQTLLGAWPLEDPDADSYRTFVERIQGYMEKATREAKVHTSWINPNDAYDQGLRGYVERILDRSANADFIDDFRAFHAEFVAVPGMLNALGQALLKLTLPGVPDVYQGQEVWDFSLVDPDNRRAVDYGLRRGMLEDIRGRVREVDRAEFAAEALREWRDGRIKMYLTQAALGLRRERPELFTHGRYVPLLATGPRRDNVVAFARIREHEAAVVAVPRLTASLVRENGGLPPGPDAWKGTRLEGETGLPAGRYRNVFTGVEVEVGGGAYGLDAAALLGGFPVALLDREG